MPSTALIHSNWFTRICVMRIDWPGLTRGQDVILHYAGQVAVTTSVQNPRGDFEDNALGTFNALEAARVPVRYVGQTVEVRETATHYVIVAGDTCIAQHAKAGRHAAVMEPAHYAGLLRPGAPPLTDAPQWDPAYHALGAVEVRDLAIYETLSGIGGGQ